MADFSGLFGNKGKVASNSANVSRGNFGSLFANRPTPQPTKQPVKQQPQPQQTAKSDIWSQIASKWSGLVKGVENIGAKPAYKSPIPKKQMLQPNIPTFSPAKNIVQHGVQDAANIGKSVARAPFRAAASVGMELTPQTIKSPIPKSKSLLPEHPTLSADQFKPGSMTQKAFKLFYGDEPVKSMSDQANEMKSKYKLNDPEARALIAGSTLLDLFPFGAGGVVGKIGKAGAKKLLGRFAEQGLAKMAASSTAIKDLTQHISDYKGFGGFTKGKQVDNAALRDITALADHPDVVKYTQAQVGHAINTGQMHTAKDGTITLYRAGNPSKGSRLVSASYDRNIAQKFVDEAKSEGRSIPLEMFKVHPADIKTFIGKAEKEVLVPSTHVYGKPVIKPILGAPTKQAIDQAGKEVSPQARSTITLGSGVDPGVDKFITREVKPVIQESTSVIKGIKDMFDPANASKLAKRTALVTRETLAKVANLSAITTHQALELTKHFNKFTDAENIANISSYEKTGIFANAPKGYSEFYKTSTDAAHEIFQKIYGNDKLAYVDNYVRRAYKFASATEEKKGVQALTNFTRSLSASKSVFKKRTLNMPLDEALQYMKSKGIKVEMQTTNPELIRQWTVKNAQRALVYADHWTNLKNQGLIKFVKTGGKLPEDMVKLDDRAAQVFYKVDASVVKGGAYYADQGVARVLNNIVSKGLQDVPGFKGLRMIENSLNQMQLGISAFHLAGVSINAGISDVALGMRDLMHGNLLGAVPKFTRAAIPFGSFAKDLNKGRSFINDLKNNSPEAFKFLEEKFNPAGARLGLDERYQLNMWEKMKDSYTHGDMLGGTLRLPQAVVEKVASPLLQYAVPRVKIGSFMNLAESALKKLPADATKEMQHQALAESWDSIDNRFGQLVYDNLFWNKAGKDIALFSARSVGWNLGTVREIGGGVADIATKTLRGKGVTDRTLYSIALPMYVGTIGAIYQYLHTGKAPTQLKDYFYPQNGNIDKNGNPDRISLPTYMKDVYAYTSDPVGTVQHKAAPLIAMMFELGANQDYFGTMIVNKDDSILTQGKQLLDYTGKGVLPFSVQQMFQQRKQGAKPEQQVESFFGFVKAPQSIVRSPAQNEITKQFLLQGGKRVGTTPEQYAAQQAKSQAKYAAQPGRNGIFEMFKKLSPDRKLVVLNKMDSSEKQKLLNYDPALIDRLYTQSDRSTTTDAQRQNISKVLKLFGK